MKKIKKLTPAYIKQIIAEEKQNIQKELNEKMLEEKKALLEKLRLLKKINDRQNSTINESKNLNRMKIKLIKSIKGQR